MYRLDIPGIINNLHWDSNDLRGHAFWILLSITQHWQKLHDDLFTFINENFIDLEALAKVIAWHQGIPSFICLSGILQMGSYALWGKKNNLPLNRFIFPFTHCSGASTYHLINNHSKSYKYHKVSVSQFLTSHNICWLRPVDKVCNISPYILGL